MIPINYHVNDAQDVWRLAEELRCKAASVPDFDIIDDFFHLFMDDYAYYAHRALSIKTKTKGIQPFAFNRAQWYVHACIEHQRMTKGRVRVIVVKGRQQGISTYTEGRGYWKASQTEACNTVILTHEDKATNNLFDMAKRYHEYCPEDLKPGTGKYNGKTIEFPMLDSMYKVFTAGAKGTGRSQTATFFHGSEVAFWPHAEEHSSGILQGISNEPGTEVIMESTAYGNTGYFAEQWEKGFYPGEEPGDDSNGYLRIFVPWFWDPGYREPVSDKFTPSDTERELMELYDLDHEQLQWRRIKIAEVNGDLGRFQRDYPATPEEAFNVALDNLLIAPELVVKARKNFKRGVYDPIGPVVIGGDVAREGDDTTCIVIRQGRVLLHFERLFKKKAHEVAARVQSLASEYHPKAIFIDSTGGYGAGVIDFLNEIYKRRDVVGVNFATSATKEDQFYRIRTEMWWNMAKWLEAGASVPDSAELQKDLCSPLYFFQPGTDQMRLESKKDMKSRGIKSPDIGDALALTLAYPVSMDTMSDYYEPEEV